MNDLLGTVKGSQGPGRGPQVFDIEAGFTAGQSERTKEMEEFFLQVDQVKQAIAAIKTKQREIQRMHEQSKTIVRKADMQQHRGEVQVRLCNAGLASSSCCASQCAAVQVQVCPQPAQHARHRTVVSAAAPSVSASAQLQHCAVQARASVAAAVVSRPPRSAQLLQQGRVASACAQP